MARYFFGSRGPRGFGARRGWFAVLAAVVAGACLMLAQATAQGQDGLRTRREQFEREADPVRKAKLYPKLGEAQFAEIQRQAEAGNYKEALVLLEKYFATLRELHRALKAAVPDPEKRSGGFKQLQIHVRRMLRSLDQTIAVVPYAEREPFVAGRRELDQIDRALLDDLFPRQPGKKNDKEKPKPQPGLGILP